jgi:hypothetical protein
VKSSRHLMPRSPAVRASAVKCGGIC